MLIRSKVPGLKNKLALFSSKPVILQVQPRSITNPTKGFQPVGNLIVEESLTAEDGLIAGRPFLYHFSISGDAILLPIEPPRPIVQGIDITLVNISDEDTLREAVLHSRKTFTYSVVAKNEGKYSLKNTIKVPYYNSEKDKPDNVISDKTFSISSGTNSKEKRDNATFYSMNHCILIDASQSMDIEDYTPNRLGAVKLGVLEFLGHHQICDIGICAFSRYVDTLPIQSGSDCYDERAIYDLKGVARGGTALGNAICLSYPLLKPDIVGRKIVIIGDGDNTAGPVGIQYAINFAKRNNLKVYAIGVGNRGLVPYGVNAQGKPNMIYNTFNDRDFKRIAQATGGKYFHAKSPDEIAKILSDIFK